MLCVVVSRPTLLIISKLVILLNDLDAADAVVTGMRYRYGAHAGGAAVTGGCKLESATDTYHHVTGTAVDSLESKTPIPLNGHYFWYLISKTV